MNKAAPAPAAAAVAPAAAGPTKFLRPGKVVVLLNGRHAGKKAFIVNPFEGQATKQRPYSHALIVGIARAPLRVTASMSKKRIHRRSRVKPFIKMVNYNHVMPTRYVFDLDVKNVVTNEVAGDVAKRRAACTVLSKKLEEKYKTGTNKWFFQKLRF